MVCFAMDHILNSHNLDNSKSKISSLSLLFPILKIYKRDIFFAFIALVTTALMILFFGKAIKYLIDFGFVGKSQSALNLTLLQFVIAIFFMAIAGYYRSYLINTVADKIIIDLRKKTFKHITRLSAEFFEVTKVGDIISRLTSDTIIVQNTIASITPFFLRNLLLFIGGISFLFFTSPHLTFVTFAIIPIAIAPIILMNRSIKKLSFKSQEVVAEIGSHVEETVNGIKTIQSYLCEEKEIRNFNKFADLTLDVSLKKNHLKSLMIALVIALAFSGIILVIWLGSHFVLQNRITSGELSSFIFYSIITATSLVSLSQISGQMQSFFSALNRILNLLKIEPSVHEAEELREFPNCKEIKIDFQNVNFAYPSRKNSAVLKSFNLEINPREKIAIIGSSGSGKSTIFQLLLRFYDIDSGSIFLNQIDIKSLSFADLRKNFSYISQDCLISSGTIFDNIAYVDKSVTRQKVEEIVSQNPALHFIKNMPQGLDTFVGQKGIALSGGEKQRISIARAIVKDSPILLLDEATSSLDEQNEQIIHEVISDFSKDKTVITIAHKLSSVSNCDRFVLIKEGEGIEISSYQELLKVSNLK